jgi:2-dehydropantoate 2-reductase
LECEDPHAAEEVEAMKFLVVGTGGVGGYVGGKLAHAGSDVWFVARGEHLRAMRASGLRVRSAGEEIVIPPGKMTDDPNEAGPADVILFCVKAYDTESVARTLLPIVTPSAAIISLQNGIDNEEKIAAVLPGARVCGGAAYIYSNITAPGEITERGGPRRIVFGPMDGQTTARDENILSAFTNAGIDATLSADMRTDLWKKFIFIAGGGGFTTLARLTLADVLKVEASRKLLHESMSEVEHVARACGVQIPDGFIDRQFASLEKLKNDAYTSMYYDLINRKPLEIDALSGTVVRLGAEHEIATPIHRTIYAALLPYHLQSVR